MVSLDHILHSVFGLKEFRPHQSDIISDVLAGHDVVCVMPTGAGKSLCFQLPAVACGGLTIIVSPLISLMADQVQHLRKLKIPALVLNSSQRVEEQRQVISRLYDGFSGLLYIAPERFSAPSFQRLMPRLQPSLFVVDEAHCVSFWGHDFRPEYMQLAEVRQQLGSPVTIAVTATATPQVRDDMVRMLGLRGPKMHVTGFDRSNLTYACRKLDRVKDKDAALLRFLRNREGSGIVYCSTRKTVEALAALLDQECPDRTVTAYHAGMEQTERARSQSRFMKADHSIVVATNAFGMGINKPDIRFVVHYNLPGSVEAFYQEAGRAGRDGEPANCVLFFNDWDLKTQNFFIENIGENNPALSKQEVQRLQQNARRKLDWMLNFATSMRCRRRQILDYFGEKTPIANCDCDVCSTVAHHRYQPDGDKPVVHLRLPEEPSVSRKGKRELSYDYSESKGRSHHQAKAQAELEGAAPLDDVAKERFDRLREVRLNIAHELKCPAFVILQDRVLKEIACQAPKSMAQLIEIKGIGSIKAARFGETFLKALREEDEDKERASLVSGKKKSAKPQPRVSVPHAKHGIDVAPPAIPAQPEHFASAIEPAVPHPAVAPDALLDAAAQGRYERLIAVRAQISNEQNYPEYFIALDDTLREIARLAPRSFQSLAAIQGVGPRKAAKFGPAFLTAIHG